MLSRPHPTLPSSQLLLQQHQGPTSRWQTWRVPATTISTRWPWGGGPSPPLPPPGESHAPASPQPPRCLRCSGQHASAHHPLLRALAPEPGPALLPTPWALHWPQDTSSSEAMALPGRCSLWGLGKASLLGVLPLNPDRVGVVQAWGGRSRQRAPSIPTEAGQAGRTIPQWGSQARGVKQQMLGMCVLERLLEAVFVGRTVSSRLSHSGWKA